MNAIRFTIDRVAVKVNCRASPAVTYICKVGPIIKTVLYSKLTRPTLLKGKTATAEEGVLCGN